MIVSGRKFDGKKDLDYDLETKCDRTNPYGLLLTSFLAGIIMMQFQLLLKLSWLSLEPNLRYLQSDWELDLEDNLKLLVKKSLN